MTMTSKRRHLSLLNWEIPDRIPIAPRIWAYLLEQKNTHIEFKKVYNYDPIIYTESGFPFYFDKNYDYMKKYTNSMYIKNTKKLVSIEYKKNDTKKYVTTEFNTPAGLLTQIQAFPEARDKSYGIQPNPHLIEPLIKDRSDLEKIKYLMINEKYFPEPIFKKVEKTVKEDGIVHTRITAGVDDMVINSLGLENALVLYYDDNAFLHEVITTFHQYYKKLLKHTLENGASIIFESWFNASLSTGWSPKMYRELFLDKIIDDINLTHNYDAFFHFYDDGKIMPLAKDFANSGMDMITTLTPPPSGDVNAVEIKKIMKNKVVLSGYVDTIKLRYGKPQEITDQTKFACETLGKDGGFILGTSDSIRDGSPKENVDAYFKAAIKYGKY